MQYPFLEDFSRRMRMVSMFYHLLSNNNTDWKEYGFAEKYEQINLLLSVYIYIVERYFTDDFCTSEEISNFIHDISIRYFHKDIDRFHSKRFTEFILDTVLSDNGKIINFKAYDYKEEQYIEVPVTLIENRCKDERGETSIYAPTIEGIEMLMRTLDIDEEMRLTMSQLIFKKSLNRKNYTSALEESKKIVRLIKQQKMKNEDSLHKARKNIFDYSADNFHIQYRENLSIIKETFNKLKELKNIVNEHVNAINNVDGISQITLGDKADQNIKILEKIKEYLSDAISMIQEVLSGSTNLALLLTKRLKNGFLLRSPRFSILRDYFDPLLSGELQLEAMEHFFHPLFQKKPDKIFNLEKAIAARHRVDEISKPVQLGSDEISDEEWRQKLDEEQKSLNNRYENCLLIILECACKTGQASLAEIWERISASAEDRERFLSDIDIVKAVIAELVRAETIEMEDLFQEIDDKSVVLGPIQSIRQKYAKWRGLKKITARKTDDKEISLLSQDGLFRLTVTNVCFSIALEI